MTQPTFDSTTCLLSNGINACDSFFATGLTTPTAAADPTGNVFYTYSTHHVYRTADGGASFQSIYQADGSSSAPVLKTTDGGRGVAVSPTDTDHLATVSAGGRVLTTADGGQHWSVSSIPRYVPGWKLGNQSPSYSTDKVLWVGSIAVQARAPRVARSGDGGLTWQSAGAGLPDLAVSNVVADPADPAGNTAYAGSPIGVYETVNGGASWHLYGSGLPVVQVTGMYLNPDGHSLLVATFGRGVWEINR